MSEEVTPEGIDLAVVLNVDLGLPVGQMRARPVKLGRGKPTAFLCAYSADFDVDPYIEMFFFPKDSLKLAVVTTEGGILWVRDLGPGVVPGMWFCPVQAFDLDNDGIDEIWFVNNVNAQHPLSLDGYRLERLDARTGESTGQWPWPAANYDQTLSHMFRNFIVGGKIHGKPVLVTAQGTYQDMHLQGWNPDMSSRWTLDIPDDQHGARGSHMAPVVDIDQDGVDELMWGERCIRLDNGTQMFCADEETYHGHSDIIWPVLHPEQKKYYIFTAREGHHEAVPRVILFDGQGKRIWGDVDQGHMDMGWVANLGATGRMTATAIRIGHKVCGPDGRFHENMTEFAWDAFTGEPLELGFSTYRTIPVDLNGDGLHELVRGIPGGSGEVLDSFGKPLGSIGGPVCLHGAFMDLPGEQLLSYYPDGTLKGWADVNAGE